MADCWQAMRFLVQVMRDALKTKRACPDSEDQPGGAAGSSRSGRRTRRAVFQAAPKRDGRSFPGSAAKCNRSGWNDTGGADCGGDAADTALLREANALLEKAQKLLSVGRSRTVFSMISEERPGWLIELLSHKQLPDKIVTDETLVYTALEDLYGSGASGIEKKLPAAAADSVERFGKRTQELPGGTKCPEISFYRDSRPNLFCTLWACREAGRSAFEARLAKIRRISGYRTNRSTYGDRCQYRKI